MTTIFDGRFTAHTDEPFVVFLIGMRINPSVRCASGFQYRVQWPL